MKNTWNNLDRIESWKYGEMDPEQKVKFELEMKHDSSLAEDIKTYENIIEHVERFGNERTRKAIMSVESKLDKEGFFGNFSGIVKPLGVKASVRNIWAIAASLMLVVVATWVIFDHQGASSIQVSPVAQNHNAIPLPNIAKLQIEGSSLDAMLERLIAPGFGSSKSKNDSLAEALGFYKKDEYAKARMMLLAFLASYPNDNTAQLYLGLSFLQEGEYGKAAKYLTPLVNIADYEDRNIAKWYAAMCYTQFGSEADLNTAKTLFKELADDPASRYEDYAKAYLRLLNNYK